MTPTLSTIHVYPVKSCAPLALDEAVVEGRGLAGDRRWMLVDADDAFVTGRKFPRLTLVVAHPQVDALRLDAPGMPTLRVEVPDAGSARVDSEVWGAAVRPRVAADSAHAWFSDFLGHPVRLVYMDDGCARFVRAKYEGRYGRDGDQVSFADAFPLMLISQASLDALNARLEVAVPMLRFRPNIVIAGTTEHAEDDWKRIRIGAIEFEVAKACTRCVFTTVDFERGQFDPTGEPLRTLIGYRRAPDGVRFGQNLIARGRGIVRLGDPVEILEDA
ncbi:MAG: MOSC domain-containing protein [Dokdonella sp.]|uniref:MOSC domain-containing protein n=1 Tax=Dokdonella sp. TaxID=2291710 RepID=UPI003264099E